MPIITDINPLNPPNIKASLSGVTVLHNHFFLSRYSGKKTTKPAKAGKIEEPNQQTQKTQTDTEPKATKKYSVNKSQVRKRILGIINQQSGNKQLFFYTISFPVQMSDGLAYKILNSTLTTLRTSNNVTKYVWVAERQQIGTIHYHIAMPHKINITYFNSVVKNLISYYIRKGQLNWSQTQAAKYNGVDISKDRKTRKVINFAKGHKGKKLARYLTKYCSKSNLKFSRQAWQASKEVTSLYTDFHLTLDEAERLLLEFIDRDNPVIIDTHFCFYGWKIEPPPIIEQLIHDINTSQLN